MYINESPINNNENVKSEIQKEFSDKVIEKIQRNHDYRQFLVNTESVHEKLLATLRDAIKMHESNEEYEVCADLNNYRCEILSSKIIN